MIRVISCKYALKENEHQYKKEHALSRRLLCYGLQNYYGLSYDCKTIEKEIGSGKYGKPYLKNYPEIHFNISHCDGIVVCAIADFEIGVDTERVKSFPVSMVRKMLTEKEQRVLNEKSEDLGEFQNVFFRYWTLKESYLKWEGHGFYKDPLTIEFEPGASLDSGDEMFLSVDKKTVQIQRCLEADVVISVCFDEKEKGEIVYELYEEKMAGACSKLSD